MPNSYEISGSLYNHLVAALKAMVEEFLAGGGRPDADTLASAISSPADIRDEMIQSGWTRMGEYTATADDLSDDLIRSVARAMAADCAEEA